MTEQSAQAKRHDRLTATAALAVFVLLMGFYSLTYSGIFKSGDETLFASGAVSLGGWGDLSASPDGLRAETGYVEPLQAVVGAGLYQWARLVKVGVVQTLFYSNILAVALTGLAVFMIVRQRGRPPGVAAAAALLFGLATMAWPHAKLYFRDPLAMLFVALALWSFERAFSRATWYGQAGQWLLTFGLLGVGILAKNTAAFALPAFLLSAGIRAVVMPSERRSVLTAAIVLVLLAGLALLIPAAGVFRHFALGTYLHGISSLLTGQVGPAFVQAILGQIFSPGKGLFFESPALLLALVALPLATRRERLQDLTAWLTVLGLVPGLAYYRDYLWFGGTGWGVRHLLPAVPMLAAACAPALQAIWASRRQWVKWAGGVLILLSVAIQVGATLLLPEVYYAWLWQVGQVPWVGAIWNPLYVEAVGYWRLLFAGRTLDLAWLRVLPAHRLAVGSLIGAWGVILAGALFLLRSAFKGRSPSALLGASAGLALLSVFLMPYALLRTYYWDPYYWPKRDDFREAAEYVTQAAQPGDAIVVRGLSDPLWKYFINYVYSPVAWYAYNPYMPEDRPSDSVLDEAASTPWLKPETERLFSVVLPQRQVRLWQVSDQCTAWADLLLEERWLAKRYVPVSSQSFQAQCSSRVSLFSLATAVAEQPLARSFDFGDGVHLVSAVRLMPPDQSMLRPGQVLPLRLEWRLTQPAGLDYTIGVYLLDSGGVLKAQQDGSARGGFYPMTHWPVGTLVLDQSGLELPRNLLPGDYLVAVAVYNWQTGDRLPVSSPSGPVADKLARLFTVKVSAP